MDEPKTPLQRAVEACKGQAELARRIGRSQQIIAYWMKEGKRVPAEVAPAIEQAVDGIVTRQELRPDVAWFPAAPERIAS